MIKKKRWVVEAQTAAYHVMSRTAFKSLKFHDHHKTKFKDFLRRQATFCGVEVLNFCLLDNHFHLLIRIPYKRSVPDKEILRRYEILYEGNQNPNILKVHKVAQLLKENGEKGKALRKQLRKRMGCLATFVKELKQRFGIWYNALHGNEGTLWGDKFKSTLVENTPNTLEEIALYMDLNPLRVKACERPHDYKHSSFGSALNHCALALTGIQGIYSLGHVGNGFIHYQKQLENILSTNRADHYCLHVHLSKCKIIGSWKFRSTWANHFLAPGAKAKKLGDKAIDMLQGLSLRLGPSIIG